MDSSLSSWKREEKKKEKIQKEKTKPVSQKVDKDKKRDKKIDGKEGNDKELKKEPRNEDNIKLKIGAGKDQKSSCFLQTGLARQKLGSGKSLRFGQMNPF